MSLQKQVLCFVYILKLINRSLSALVKVWNPLALQRRMTENERSGLVFSSLGLKLYGEENGRFSCLPPQVPLGSSPLTSVQGSRHPGSSPRSSQKTRSGLGNGNAAEGHRKGIESWGESPRTPLSLPSALPGGKSNDVPGDKGRPEWRDSGDERRAQTVLPRKLILALKAQEVHTVIEVCIEGLRRLSHRGDGVTVSSRELKEWRNEYGTFSVLWPQGKAPPRRIPKGKEGSFFFSFGHTAQPVGSKFPNQGLNPHPWQCGVLTTGLPRNFREVLFKTEMNPDLSPVVSYSCNWGSGSSAHGASILMVLEIPHTL